MSMSDNSTAPGIPRHIHFVTGRLAEQGLRQVVERLAQECGFAYSIDVMPISVAALLTPTWISKRLQVPDAATEILLPGYCDGDLRPIQDVVRVPVRVGPRDFLGLPEYFGREHTARESYGEYSIEIIAEINHAPRWHLQDLLRTARQLAGDGADVIDIGCEPGDPWCGIGECVKAVRELGLRVSVDSMNPREIAAAARAGAELVLSVNSSNRAAAPDWGCEVVVIPDDPKSLAGFDETIASLSASRVPFRIDPILDPIGCGLADSLHRFVSVRRRYPDQAMMMGIGNLTELTDADSAAINVLLLGICQELDVRSVLTTQVIPWARTSVRECDLARRLVHFALRHGTVPKHMEPRLIVLRDARKYPRAVDELVRLQEQIKDPNYRVFAENGQLHVLNSDVLISDAEPFQLFAKLMATEPKNIDVAHAFYLGYELAKARTALTLDKQYQQDEALDWGYLTVPETHHRRNKPDGRE
jgi:dihydropteroate synthase-like protein